MYLLIFEDGRVMKSKRVDDDDLMHCDDGIMDIIDLRHDQPMAYYNGEWNEIEEA